MCDFYQWSEYGKFSDYFEIRKEYDWLIKYIVTKEPSAELINAVEAYYAKVKEKNRKHDEFVSRVAEEVYSGLSDKDKAYIFDYPDSTEHHVGLDLGVRSKYIYGHDLDFDYYEPDGLSSEITSRIASLVVDDYAAANEAEKSQTGCS